MLQLRFHRHDMVFKIPATTSRGTLNQKPCWILELNDSNIEGRLFHGECSIIPDLSFDNLFNIEKILNQLCDEIHNHQNLSANIDLSEYPALNFALETLRFDHVSACEKILFQSDFTASKRSIPINGLIWMAERSTMLNSVKRKLDEGWNCLKLKIGGIDFEDELRILGYIRREFSGKELEIRLDANGAFSVQDAYDRLERLSKFKIHSIEQPIRQNQWEEMAKLCNSSPIDIALDEELIGISDIENKEKMLTIINPKYIILKPSLIGGFKSSSEWIDIAKRQNIGFWVTSALESNIGLNAIAQWTATLNTNNAQGLGTGSLFVNNFDSPLILKNNELYYDNTKQWKIYFE